MLLDHSRVRIDSRLNHVRELFFTDEYRVKSESVCISKLVQRSYDFISLLLKLINTGNLGNFIDAWNNISNERSLKFIKKDVKLKTTTRF